MPYVLATLLFKMLGCCCQCFIVVVTVWECLLCSDNLFMKILPECRTFQFSCWYWGKKFWCTCVEISLDLVQKVFLFSLTFLDDSIICNDSVFLVRWCKWTELAQEKRYLNCVLSCSSASLKMKVAVQLANLIPLFCLSALCLSLLSQWHIHKLLFAVGS